MAGSGTTERPDLDRLMADVARRARIERTRNLTIAAVVVVAVLYSAQKTEVDIPFLLNKSPALGRMLSGFLHPDLSILALGSAGYPEGLVEHYVVQTLFIALVGTFAGAIVAIPVSFLAARNLMRQNAVGTAMYYLVRTLMSIIRAVPTLFWGLLFATAVVLGPFPGVIAITIFTFGLMSKLFSEAIEAIDWGQVEALTATGATPIQVVIHGVVPQVVPYMIAHLLYTLEVNVHSATVLGIVGAGGIGYLLLSYINEFQYPNVAVVLLVTIVMTVAIDNASAALRRRVI
jgi:phosphonate transport system permease protein